MLFIIMTISFTASILLAMGLATYIMMHPKVMKWYTKRVMKMMGVYNTIFDEIEDESK